MKRLYEIDRRKARADWADVAKGACIVLVVAWHVIMKLYLQVDWRLPVPIPGLWGFFGDQLLPLRMPLFFTISGLFAANAVLRPWNVTAKSRIAKFYYLYAVWFIVHTSILAFVPSFDTLAAHSVLEVSEQLTITPTNLWYLVALALYFVVAKLTYKLPAWAVLGPALVLSTIASAGLLAAPGNRGQLYQNLFFFLVGLRSKSELLRWAKSSTMKVVLIGAGCYFAMVLVVRVLDAKQWFGVWPLVSAVAVLVGIVAAVQVERFPRVTALLTHLGRNTLPIYVMHMPMVALAYAALVRPFSAAPMPVQFLLALVLPIVLTTLFTAACLTLRRYLPDQLFELPEWKKKEPAVPEQRFEDQPTMVPGSVDAMRFPEAPGDQGEPTAERAEWGDTDTADVLAGIGPRLTRRYEPAR